MTEIQKKRPVNLETIKISFRNSYTDKVIDIFSNHDYYITYKPTGLLEFKTISCMIIGIDRAAHSIKVKTSVVDELVTVIPVSTILSATLIETNNTQTTVDFIGVEISNIKLIMSLHLKYLSGDYIQNVAPGEVYEITFIQSRNGNLELVTVVGKLVRINYPYNTFTDGSCDVSTFHPITQARNQNPNCIFTFDCSNDYSSVRIKIDLRDIRGIKEYVIEDVPKPDPNPDELPDIPEGYSYVAMKTEDGQISYVEVIDENGKPAIVYGK